MSSDGASASMKVVLASAVAGAVVAVAAMRAREKGAGKKGEKRVTIDENKATVAEGDGGSTLKRGVSLGSIGGVNVRMSTGLKVVEAKFVRNLGSVKNMLVRRTSASTEDNGMKPAWGKESMGTDIMFTSCGEGGQTSLDAFEPMERVALNASGTFQRTVSSYYHAPVVVETDYNTFPSRGRCHRQVTMSVGSYEFAVCTSYMEVTRPDCLDAVENKGIAIGQLFRHFEMMPKYALLAAGMDGQHPDRFIWRVYTLTADGVMCRIHEKIRRDVFDLELDEAEKGKMGSAGADVVKPNVTFMELPEGFSQLERILLTANANVERIISSYYNMPTIVHVMQNYRREPCVFERRTAMLMHGEEFMYATVTVFLSDPKWEEVMLKNHKMGLGQVFTMMGTQPTFKLRDAGRTPNSFWRCYTLSSQAVSVQITETFNMYIFALDDSSANEYKFVYSSDVQAEAPNVAIATETEPSAECASPLRNVPCGKWHSAFDKLAAARAITRVGPEPDPDIPFV